MEHLAELVPLNEETGKKLDEYFARDSEPPDDDPEFGEICYDLWELEHEIKLDIDTAIFMSAIVAEDAPNRFCAYSLHATLPSRSKRCPRRRNSRWHRLSSVAQS